jgi:hypothetical protein
MSSDWTRTSKKLEGPMPEQRLVSMKPSIPLLLKNLPFKASSMRVLNIVR